MEVEPKEAGISTSAPPANTTNMTLEKAIELGEFEPSNLARFPQWHTMSRHVQFEYIRKALDNHNRQLVTQWAEINNVLDFRTKPHLKKALENLEEQIRKLRQRKEELYLEYSAGS